MHERFVFPEPGFPYCHASSCVETDSGLRMVCCAGPAEGHRDTGIWTADFNEEWGDQKQLINLTQEDGQTTALWNPVLFRSGNETTLYYRIGKSPETWECAHISIGDSRVLPPSQTLPSTLMGPVRNKPIQLKNGDIIVPTSTEAEEWGIHFEVLRCKGSEWASVAVQGNGLSAIQPAVIEHDDDTLQALCRTKNSYIAETWSYDMGKSWSELKCTELINPNAAIDAIKYDGFGFILVYNNCKHGRYRLALATSVDGHIWDDKLILEESMGEYSYPSIEVSKNGVLHILYSYNRTNIKHLELSALETAELFSRSQG